MKKVNLPGDCFLHHPTTGIFADTLLDRQISIVGNDNGGFDFPVAGNGDLPNLFVTPLRKTISSNTFNIRFLFPAHFTRMFFHPTVVRLSISSSSNLPLRRLSSFRAKNT